MGTLPDHPADLIELALADLEKVRADDRYVVNMNIWHEPGSGGLCHACLAGSVMAMTLGAYPEAEYRPSDYPEDIWAKLRAIDRFRDGSFTEALNAMGIGLPGGIPARIPVPAYFLDPKAFIAAMRDMAAMLRAAIPSA